jgi:hypothetical protein
MDTSFPNSIVHIGNEHINNLMPIIFAPLARVIVPKRNCYSEYDWIKQEILTIANSVTDRKLLFFFSCSLVAPILVHELHTLLDGKHFLVDMGSFFDFFLGYASRTPSICMKDFLFNTYTACMTPTSVSLVQDISMSLV